MAGTLAVPSTRNARVVATNPRERERARAAEGTGEITWIRRTIRYGCAIRAVRLSGRSRAATPGPKNWFAMEIANRAAVVAKTRTTARSSGVRLLAYRQRAAANRA